MYTVEVVSVWVQTLLCPQESNIDCFYGNSSSKSTEQAANLCFICKSCCACPSHGQLLGWVAQWECFGLLRCLNVELCLLWGEKRQTKQQWLIIRITFYYFVSWGKLPQLICVLSKSHRSEIWLWKAGASGMDSSLFLSQQELLVSVQ